MYGVTFGSDPELFLENEAGHIVGSEYVVPEVSNDKRIIRDGVQVEFNPTQTSCREVFGSRLAGCFRHLNSLLAAQPELRLKPSFKAVVKVRRTEMKKLGEKARQFGCQPSLNVYGDAPVIDVDPATYLVRSAGGHIHLGLLHPLVWKDTAPAAVDRRAMLVPLLDVLVGNTCVLLDRDKKQAERRKYYGRAGEYRLQPHGLEYRTLSNFWLRHYVLSSFVLGMARLAHHILVKSLLTKDGEKRLDEQLLSTIDFDVLKKAINTNNAKLAWVNMRKVLAFLEKHHINDSPLATKDMRKRFKTFVQDIHTYGLETLFPEDPMKYWTRYNRQGAGSIFEFSSRYVDGWEKFIEKYEGRGV